MSGRVIQRRRTKGWRAPEGSVYVGRPGNWGNPFPAGIVATHREAADLYRDWLLTGEVPEPWLFSAESVEDRRQWVLAHLPDLRGKTLTCWCPQPGPCHGHVLAEFAAASRPPVPQEEPPT